ncbi:hypothetical protein AXF42_Ash008881 [Apostasia shenzhenica]|uniref:Uncharacterized protein n=1 Tax=Apostasia shenzhenica TaxID=1088818 RepID=A0A2I0ASS4_9ASPA|nr:hypothetical protein AXF42_Ash008881 [Apostasia shenzhenica]
MALAGAVPLRRDGGDALPHRGCASSTRLLLLEDIRLPRGRRRKRLRLFRRGEWEDRRSRRHAAAGGVRGEDRSYHARRREAEVHRDADVLQGVVVPGEEIVGVRDYRRERRRCASGDEVGRL